MSFSQTPSCGSRRHKRVPSEGATRAWRGRPMKQLAVRGHFLAHDVEVFSTTLVCRGYPEPGLRVNDVSRILWSPKKPPHNTIRTV
ncbi:hypothetical protein TNCV_1333101 [Trichonephila clavipes]|nr:hypothetical protein TNCV_1333101 [Trichonephila clavipes]